MTISLARSTDQADVGEVLRGQGRLSGVGAKVFRTIIVIVGLFSIFIGFNVGFGGIPTLGLQGSADFLTVTNEHAYLVRDSHIRYFGGLHGGVGLFLVLATTDLRKYQSALQLVFVVIFIGGLARFTMLRPSVVFGPDIITSLMAELVLMPVLYLWLPKLVVASSPRPELTAEE